MKAYLYSFSKNDVAERGKKKALGVRYCGGEEPDTIEIELPDSEKYEHTLELDVKSLFGFIEKGRSTR